jgi:hypothetical protein
MFLDEDKKPLSFSVVDKLVLLEDLFLLRRSGDSPHPRVVFSPGNFNLSDHGDNLCNFLLSLHSFGATLVNESSQLLKFCLLLSNRSLHLLNIKRSLLAISGFSFQLTLKSPHFVGQLLFHSYFLSYSWVHKILLGLSNLILMSAHGNLASLKSSLICGDVGLELSGLPGDDLLLLVESFSGSCAFNSSGFGFFSFCGNFFSNISNTWSWVLWKYWWWANWNSNFSSGDAGCCELVSWYATWC